jgi:hypothetical protein
MNTKKLFNMLWHNSYYDGPLSGVAQRIEDGKYLWFDCTFHDGYEYDDRRYRVYLLTEAQYQQLFENHKVFQKCVGYNCDYGEMYQPFTMKDKVLFDWYYKTRDDRPHPEISDDQLIGIFGESLFNRDK